MRTAVRCACVVLAVLLVSSTAGAQNAYMKSGSSPYGYGPLELAPNPHMGNLGAARSALPESRFGAAVHWLGGSNGDLRNDGLSLLLELHFQMGSIVEMGIDYEALQYTSFDLATGSSVDDLSLGFLVPRAKITVADTGLFSLAIAAGVAFPTSPAQWEAEITPLGIDLGLHMGLRVLDMLAVHASLPFPLFVDMATSGDTSTRAFFTPAVGVTVMPLPYIGGFLDLQFKVLMNPEQVIPAPPAAPYTPDMFQGMNILVGARSLPVWWMMLELGAIIPVAGDLADAKDVGVGFRIAFNPGDLGTGLFQGGGGGRGGGYSGGGGGGGYSGGTRCACDTTYGCDNCYCEPISECGGSCPCDTTYGCDNCYCEPPSECIGNCPCDTTYGCDNCYCEPPSECSATCPCDTTYGCDNCYCEPASECAGCPCDTTYGCDNCYCEPASECSGGGGGCPCDTTYGCDNCYCEPASECSGGGGGCPCDTTYGCDNCYCEPPSECSGGGGGCPCDTTYGCDNCYCEPASECSGGGGGCPCDTTYGCDNCYCEPPSECM
jgi:hypothetical protein